MSKVRVICPAGKKWQQMGTPLGMKVKINSAEQYWKSPEGKKD